MTDSGGERPDLDLIHVNIASAAGAYTVGDASFFRYILRLGELGLPLSLADQEAVDVLAAVPHALLGGLEDVPFVSGPGWRVVPAQGEMDWPVLEATPERLRSALERARSILWIHAARIPRERPRDHRDRARARRGLRRADARRRSRRRGQRFVRSVSAFVKRLCRAAAPRRGRRADFVCAHDSFARLRATAARFDRHLAARLPAAISRRQARRRGRDA